MSTPLGVIQIGPATGTCECGKLWEISLNSLDIVCCNCFLFIKNKELKLCEAHGSTVEFFRGCWWVCGLCYVKWKAFQEFDLCG